ncbi:hypothetical protein ACJJTC_010178 [Scirpophaga incertulas]
MLGRHLRTKLDLIRPDSNKRVREAQNRQKDLGTEVDRSFESGSEVWIRQYRSGDKWLPGKVTVTLRKWVPVPSTIPPLTLDPAQSASPLSSSDSENGKSEQTIVSAPVIEALPKTVTPPPPRLIRSCRLKPVSYKY